MGGLLMLLIEVFLVWHPFHPEDHGYTQDVHGVLYSLTVLAYAPMFGVEWAACSAGRLATTTTAATGHIVNLCALFVKRCLKKELSATDRIKLVMGICVLVSNFLGAIVGALVFLMLPTGSHGALLPLGPTLAVLFWLHDHLAKPLSLVKKMQKLQAKLQSPDSEDDYDSDSDFEDEEDSDDHDGHEGGARECQHDSR